MKKKSLLIWIMILAIGLAACGNNDQPIEYISAQELSDNYFNFDNVKGKYISLIGTCAEASQDGDQQEMMIYLDPEIDGKPVYITYSGDVVVLQGEQVQVDGKLDETKDYTNPDGVVEKAPHITADKITILEPTETTTTASTTAVTASPGSQVFTPTAYNVISQSGVTVKIDRAEFDDQRTIVTFTVDNQSASAFLIDQTNTEIWQYGVALECYTNTTPPAGMTALPTSIKAGETQSGVLMFWPANADDFDLYLAGSLQSGDPIKEFQFGIQIP